HQDEQARRELATYLRSQADPNVKLFVEALTLAFMGDEEAAERKLDASLDAPQVDDLRLWSAAEAYSLMSWAVAGEGPDRAKSYADRAVALLRERAAKLGNGA